MITTHQWRTCGHRADYAREAEHDRECPAAEAETLAREFARVYDTPNVRRAVALCESGRLEWVDVAALFARSYVHATKGEVK